MPTKSNIRPGRPVQDTQKQARLIEAARELFIADDYDRVSTRKIALKAGVDPALIRYYFGSKMQLFAAMIRETTAPLSARMQIMKSRAPSDGPAQMLRTYYQVMAENPDFPKLIFRLASVDTSNDKNKELWQLLIDILRPQEMDLFEQLKKNGLLKDNIEPACARVSFISLMVFPFLMPDNFKKMYNIKFTDEFLAQLAEQNIQLLSLGLLKPQDKNNHGK
ncbi:TetR/AcrR family transcriptional regulator [Psychromonas aquimarina]|uniref:TetR/AcrR family transcriptional regulator n=1 Tax=Psychromonas aquimarina TaxID=444919 RepID=UPI0004277C74|nr:TetR/AcrR family transcriptional regulator [Psychromonas aquimarina]